MVLVGANKKTVSVDRQHAFSAGKNALRQPGYFLQRKRSSMVIDCRALGARHYSLLHAAESAAADSVCLSVCLFALFIATLLWYGRLLAQCRGNVTCADNRYADK